MVVNVEESKVHSNVLGLGIEGHTGLLDII